MAIIPVTWDSVNKGAGVILSNGDLTAVIPNSSNTVRASVGKTAGKWYWEVLFTAIGSGAGLMGIVNSLAPLNSGHSTTQNSRYYYNHNGVKYPEGVTYGASYAVGDTIGVALDLDNGTLTFYKNGVSQGVSHTNILSMGMVYPAITSGGSSVGNTSTVNFGETPFKYPIPNGYRSYDNNQPVNNKVLIGNKNSFLKYNSSWQVVISASPTEADYLQGNALEEISQIPESAWKQLSGTVELCYYTDHPSVEEAQFNIETEPFTLAEEFEGKQISILEYTDNPNQEESVVETETEPFTIYEEFGDTMEVLYYTDDPNIANPKLEITANYSPLDEIEGDFEVVTWTDTLEEAVDTNIPQLTNQVIEDGSVYATEIDLSDVVKIK